MIEERDIVLVSAACLAGMWVAALCGTTHPGVALSWWTSIMILLVWSRSRADLPLLLLLWTVTGYFCYSNWALSGRSFTSPLTIDWLCRLIEKVPFEGGQTAALLQALLSGRKVSLDSSTLNAFRQSGASHVIALSGLHLGIIYKCVSKGLAVFGKRPLANHIKSILTVTLCGIYTLMTGAGPSIARAFLFIVIGEIGRLNPERDHSGIRTWCLALTIQLVLCPGAIHSVGLYLSYLAMLGIYTIFPLMRDWYPQGRVNFLRKIWEAAALSISCQIFTGPLVYLKFGTFPKYFILTNLIALPLTEGLILSGLASVILSTFGICPQFVITVTDRIAEVLIYSLSIISGL